MKEELWKVLYNLEDHLEYGETKIGKELSLFINKLQNCKIEITKIQ